MKQVWLAAVLYVAFSGSALAHLCNNIYRTPDRLVVKPEKGDLSVDKSEEFRIFVKNNYPTHLNNVRVAVRADDPSCHISISPQAVPRMRAGEKAEFRVRVEVAQGARAGRKRLEVGVSADQVGFRPATEASTAELRQVLKDGNPSPVVLACESLARRGDQAGVNWLQQKINGSDRAYVVRSLRAAGKSGNRGLVPSAKAKLSDADGMVRGTALLALGLLGVERAAIQGLLADADEFVRVCAGAALAMQGDQGQLAALRQALGSSNQWAQAAAAWGLGLYGDKAAIDVLDRLFESSDSELKVMAGDALLNIAEKYADIRQISAPAVGPSQPPQAAVPGPRKPRPAARPPGPRPSTAPRQPDVGSKMIVAAGYICAAVGLAFLAYLAHQKWGVRRRR